MNIDPKVVKAVFPELETMKDGECCSFYYRGDNISSEEEKRKFESIKFLISEHFVLVTDYCIALGNQNECELMIKLTSRGLDLFNDLRRNE